MTNPTNDGYDTYGDDANNQANESVADQLVQSGNDFSWADYNMHRNGGKQNSYTTMMLMAAMTIGTTIIQHIVKEAGKGLRTLWMLEQLQAVTKQGLMHAISIN